MNKLFSMKKRIILFLLVLTVLLFGGLTRAKAEIITRPEVNVTLRTMFDEFNIIENSTISGAYGSTLTMSGSLATSEDYTFAFWIVNGTVRKDLPIDHPFILTKDISIDAVFSQTGEHAVIFMDSNGKLIDIQYVLTGTDATDITTGLPDKPFYVISTTEKWDLPLTNITEDTVRILQYLIDTTQNYSLNVIGGTGSGSYLFNSVATLVPTPETGQVFQYWKIGNEIVSYSENYLVTLYTDLTVEAIYGTETLSAQPVVSISEPLALRTSKSSFVGQMYIPSEYTLIEYGMTTSPLACECITLDDPSSTQRQASKYFGLTGEFLMTFTTLEIGHVMAYMILKDASNNLLYFESEQQRVPDVLNNEIVELNSAENFVILTKTGISTTGSTFITGDIGVSPAALSYLTGFALVIDISGVFATSTLIDGFAYGADLLAPTPANLTAAVSAMEAAYTDAASRAPDCININSGDLSGKNLSPGVFKFDMGVLINSDLTLTGSASDVWIFQIATTLTISDDVSIILAGGAVPENVFWQTGTSVSIGANVNFQGILLAGTAVSLGTNSTVLGKLLSQTAVTLISNTIEDRKRK